MHVRRQLEAQGRSCCWHLHGSDGTCPALWPLALALTTACHLSGGVLLVVAVENCADPPHPWLAEWKDAEGYGWDLGGTPTVDWAKLMDKKTKEITRLNGVYGRILGNAGVTVIQGQGSLVDKNTVKVTTYTESGAVAEQRTLTTKYILICTGGRASYLDIPGKELGITSDHLLSLPVLPQKIIVLGSGYIAVEMASIMRGFGAHVDIVFRQPIPLRGFDKDVREVVMANLQKRGIITHPLVTPTKIEKAADSLCLTLSSGETLTGDTVLFATGRHANVASLNLGAVGVELNAKGAIKVDELSQTSVPNIYAVGDVTDRINLTPVALHEGECFVKTVFRGTPTPVDHADVASGVFCQPNVGVCGLSEEDAVEQLSGSVDVYVSKFKPMKHTLSGRDEQALMKLIVHHESDRVVGAHVVVEGAAEIIQGIGIALKCNATKAQFDATIGVHPTAAEELVTMRSLTRNVPALGKGNNKSTENGHKL
eukprot:jgi/Mesvir1/10787/Mv13842-RA.2